MKTIAALLLSTAALLTYTPALAGERWGWSAVTEPQLWTAAKLSSWVVPVGTLATSGDAPRVRVVHLKTAIAKVTGAAAGVGSPLDVAVDAIRTVVASDADLVKSLKARGLSPDDVVGLGHSPSGEVTLFVDSRA